MIVTVNSLNETQISQLIRTVENYKFMEQSLLMGLVSRLDNFMPIFEKCLSEGSETEKALCTGSLIEWKMQRGENLSSARISEAVKFISSKSVSAKHLVSLSIVALDYYDEKLYQNLLDIMNILDSENSALGREFKHIYEQALSVITDTDINGFSKSKKHKHFKEWLKNNRDLLKPSKHIRKGETIYTNYLHRFSLNIPLSYQRVYNPKLTQGMRCMFADPYGRSIAVETRPITGGIGLNFYTLEKVAGAIKYKDLFINMRPAIKYKIEVEKGHFIGLLVELDDRLVLAKGFTPIKNDSFSDIEKLVDGLMIM